MRGLRRLTIVASVLFLIAAFQPYVGTLFASHQTLFYRSNARGGFQPVGIDFNFRLSEPTQENVARMLVTRPLSGNPRELQQRDANATGFRLRITLPDRSSNNPFIDSVAAIPDALGGATTGAGFTPNDILLSQGLKVYKISGAEWQASALPLPALTSTSTPFVTIGSGTPPGGSTCTSGNSDLIFDRWGLQFGGKAILTCQGSSGLEVWTIAQTSPSTGTPTYLRTLTGTYSGRADLTSPNFSGCGGCLAVVADSTLNVTLVSSGDTSTITITGISANSGKRQVLTVPPRVYEFGTSPGCLFGTVPSANSILQFPCSPPDPTLNAPNVVFKSTANGDLLIFTPSATVVRVKYTVGTSCSPAQGDCTQVDTTAGTYEDLAFSPRRQVEIIVQQPAVPNPNQGVQGNILFYILSIVNPTTGLVLFDPQHDVNISSILFGRTGSEPSVNGNCNAGVGTDVNKDGVPDLKCFADPAIAQCGGLVLCIVTGFTENPSGFEGD